MTSQEILRKYLEYYQERGHVLIPNLSLVPEGDSTLLFVNSGMFPLVPYLFGEPHPLGSRLVSIQRAVRFDDLEEVGDNRHTTVFHMIGNWSLGDYFKKEQLPWIWEFFVKELGLNINKMYGTVFSGDQYAERDVTSIALLKEIFVSYGIEDPKEGERIFAYAGNWWQRGDAIGELGGPDSEVFYYIGEDGTGLGMDPETDEDKFIEIGNTVFLQFKRTEEGWEELPQKNVDFGGGFERIAMVVQGKNDIFETDNFWPIIQKIQELSGKDYYGDKGVQRIMRILADHIRSATFISMDGVVPGNKDQGYVLRRFLRRMVRFARKLDISKNVAGSLVPTVATMFEWIYPDLPSKQWFIIGVFTEEEEKFSKTLERGQKESVKRLDGFSGSVEALAAIAFDLYQSVGYPPEMVLEDAQDNGVEIDLSTFENTYAEYVTKHQEKSRKGAEQKFAGGLADHSEQVVKYHTTTHLLNKALRDIFGDQIMQRGSNITGERLRFDYNHDAPLTEEQIAKIEEIVNKHISENLPVNFEMMPIADAEKTGAIHAFGEKYGDTVKIYYIGDSLDRAISKEFCGGPHVSNTSELSPIEIYKQQSVGKGIRRVYVREEVIRNS
ncbi:alanine--tRNA ligase [candidate division WWE3 bacterium CG_4_10_14_0_2_um_filter_41_14]|uniref:alanine--tRNA ligase n=1 Tax=candidate division WWE3 bacterium CG_4_10_14_0_2_um_filter_41_14 TaxID=1975072 RepID=A0A2M7TEL8_UNCKA|nr:MAG: alanine--tRNA ligase [candidate division WWE3 bacterium CG_4_10_14_0_2_um_filter_41_14]